jgi:ketosteroid isomerase-like protein
MSAAEEVQNANKEWVASVNAGNVDDMIRRVADNVAFMPPGEPAVVGREAFSEYARAMFGHVSIKVDITGEEVVVGGDVGCLFGSATIAATPLEGGETMTEVVKWVHAFKLHPDGTWKMAVNTWNSDAPPLGP